MPNSVETYRARVAPGLRLAGLAAIAALLLNGCGRSSEEYVDEARELLATDRPRAAVIALKNALQADPELTVARQLLANTYLVLGDGPAAERELEKAFTAETRSTDVSLQMMRALLAQQRYEEVLTRLNALPAELSPAQAGIAALLYGEALLATGRHDAARERFAALARSGSADGYLGLAKWALATKRPALLDRHIQDARAAGADETTLALIRGEADLDAGHYKTALKRFKRAAESIALDLPARRGQIRAHLALGRVHAALAAAQQLVRNHPRNAEAFFLMGLCRYRLGDLEPATRATREALRLEPTLTPAQLLMAQLHFSADNLAQTEYYSRLVLADYPRHVGARTLLASVHAGRGDYSAARRLLHRLIAENDPPPRSALLALARLEAEFGNRSATYELLERAAANGAPRLSTEASNDRLDVDQRAALKILEQLRAGDHGAAIESAKAYIAERPDDPLGYNLAGTAYAAAGEIQLAEQSFAEALDTDPEFRAARFNLARMDLAAGRVDKARRSLDRLIEQHPDYLDARLLSARLAFEDARTDEMLEHLEHARRAHRTSLEPRITLAKWYLQRGDAARAEIYSQEAVDLAPAHPQALSLLGRSQAQAGNLAAALKTFERLTAAAPENVDGFVELGFVQSELGNADAARRAFDRALELDPDNRRAHIGLARIALAAGDHDTALELAREVQSRYPHSASGFALEGDIHFAAERPEAALDAYRAAFTSEPHTAHLVKMTQAYQALGWQGAAIDHLKAWIRNHPKDVGIRLLLADLLVRNGDPHGAIENYTRVLEQEPENLIALNNLAWQALETGDSNALRYAERAYELAPEFPLVLDTYGWILLHEGHKEQSLTMLKKARGGADSPEIRYHLAAALHAVGDAPLAQKELEDLLNRYFNFSEREQAEALLDRLEESR